MASPNSTFTELVSTTFRKHRKEIKDNMSKNNALLRRVYDKGNYRKEDGGLTIALPLDYAQNGTYQRYSDWDVLNISASRRDHGGGIPVAPDRHERGLQRPRPAHQLRREPDHQPGQSKLKNAIRTFKNNFSVDVYSTARSATR
jgi:hypothetical protein